MYNNYICCSCDSNKYIELPKLTKKLSSVEFKYKVVKCKNCGLHSLYPIPIDTDLDWIYSQYAEKGNRIEVEKLRQKYVYPRKIELIKKLHPTAKNIFDLGAGIGGFAATAIDNGYEVIGIDLEEEQVKLAKEIFDVELKHQKFKEFKKENTKKFDIVMLHHVLEHLQNPSSVLHDLQLLLANNGLIIIEIPNQFFNLKKNIYEKIGYTKYKYPHNPYHHIFFFSPKTIAELVRVAGYKIIKLNELNAKPKNTFNLSESFSKFLLHPFGYGWSSRIEVIATMQE